MTGIPFSRSGLQIIKHKIQPMLSARTKTYNFKFEGSGYRYQLEAVEDAWRRGAIEHTMMPLSDSLSVMQTLDACRNRSKVTNMSSFQAQEKVGIAFIGCGYVADYYVSTLPNHPHLNLIGVWDHDAERLKSFAEYHQLPTLDGLNDILENEEIRLVINLTNPKSHYDLNKALLAGKHVYCEKPLALEWHHA